MKFPHGMTTLLIMTPFPVRFFLILLLTCSPAGNIIFPPACSIPCPVQQKSRLSMKKIWNMLCSLARSPQKKWKNNSASCKNASKKWADMIGPFFCIKNTPPSSRVFFSFFFFGIRRRNSLPPRTETEVSRQNVAGTSCFLLCLQLCGLKAKPETQSFFKTKTAPYASGQDLPCTPSSARPLYE